MYKDQIPADTVARTRRVDRPHCEAEFHASPLARPAHNYSGDPEKSVAEGKMSWQTSLRTAGTTK